MDFLQLKINMHLVITIVFENYVKIKQSPCILMNLHITHNIGKSAELKIWNLCLFQGDVM